MKKKPTLKVKASVTGSCFIYSDFAELRCPLCGTTVPKSTKHQCSKKDS